MRSAHLACLCIAWLLAGVSHAGTTVTPYEAAYYECLDRGTPFIVWVGGMECPPCRAEIQDWRHVRVDSFDGDARPRCCVCVRLNGKQMYYEVPSPVSAAAIRAAARGERLPQAPPPQQQYFAPRMSRGGG